MTQCPFGCGQEIDIVLIEATQKKLYLNLSGSPHNCKERTARLEAWKFKKIQDERNLEQEARKARELAREPKYIMAKELNSLIDFQYLEEPKVQSIIKKVCECPDNFPIWKRQIHYFFDTDTVSDITNTFWCASCGNFLSTNIIKQYFQFYES